MTLVDLLSVAAPSRSRFPHVKCWTRGRETHERDSIKKRINTKEKEEKVRIVKSTETIQKEDKKEIYSYMIQIVNLSLSLSIKKEKNIFLFKFFPIDYFHVRRSLKA